MEVDTFVSEFLAYCTEKSSVGVLSETDPCVSFIMTKHTLVI